MGVLLAIMIIVAALSILVGVPDPLVWGTIIAGLIFVGFWVFVLRTLICFGRWLIAPADAASWRGTCGPVKHTPATWQCDGSSDSKTCRDPRCGKVNVPAARFCARCGRPLTARAAREKARG